jgi:hypothetical protein
MTDEKGIDEFTPYIQCSRYHTLFLLWKTKLKTKYLHNMTGYMSKNVLPN